MSATTYNFTAPDLQNILLERKCGKYEDGMMEEEWVQDERVEATAKDSHNVTEKEGEEKK